MEFNLYLRFKGTDNDENPVGLSELGESLVGFDYVFREFARVLRIEGGVQVSATSSRRGSVIVDTLISGAQSAVHWFGTVNDFLTFLELVKGPLWEKAQKFFHEIGGIHRTLNDYVAANPVDSAIITTLMAKAFQKLLEKARKNKKAPDYSDRELPKRIAKELNKLIKKGAFKTALTALTQDAAESIEVSVTRTFDEVTIINQTNVQDYLAEQDQILPHLKDGDLEPLSGKITSLRGTRGDSMTFHLAYQGETYNLDTLPAEGKTSKSYTNLYQEDVVIKAWVMRDSLYKKPRLKIQEIERTQLELPFEDQNPAEKGESA